MLEARDLTCRRGGRLIFRDLSFALAPGEAMILRGPNGSGKSSLLRLLAGFIDPADGALLWSGAPVTDDPALHRSRLHYVGHQDPLKSALTAVENLRSLAAIMGSTLDLGAALNHFELGPLADLPVRILSAGQKRRLSLARLAASARPLWLLDEPTVGLDLQATEQLESLLDEHRRSGGIAIIATHIGIRVTDAREMTLDARQPVAAA